MAHNAYITLKTDDTAPAEKEKKFAVIYQGYRHIYEKHGRDEWTINGKLDHTIGVVTERHEYIIRVRETESRTGYGTLADLLYFFLLNNPLNSPSNKICFIDHFGTEKTVMINGTFENSLQGIEIEGETAWSFVKLTLLVIA